MEQRSKENQPTEGHCSAFFQILDVGNIEDKNGKCLPNDAVVHEENIAYQHEKAHHCHVFRFLLNEPKVAYRDDKRGEQNDGIGVFGNVFDEEMHQNLKAILELVGQSETENGRIQIACVKRFAIIKAVIVGRVIKDCDVTEAKKAEKQAETKHPLK